MKTQKTFFAKEYCVIPLLENISFSQLLYFILKRTMLVIVLFFMTNAFAQFPPVAPVNPPTGGFEIDGNLVPNGAGDWANLAGTDVSTVLEFNGTNWVGVNPDNTTIRRDEYNTGLDSIFTGGSKFNDDPNTWGWTQSKATNKCDINNLLMHQTSDGTNKWLILGGDRLSTNGTSYIDFEFLQGTLSLNADNTFDSDGEDGGRDEGDFVLSMEYSNGGVNANVHFYVWTEVPADSGNFTYVEDTEISETLAYAVTNYTDDSVNLTPVPYEAFGLDKYANYAFVEAAVNIDAILTGKCLTANIKTVFVKTKASDSPTATLKDFVKPIPVEFSFGTAELEYEGPYCNLGKAAPKVSPSSSGMFSATPDGLVWAVSNPLIPGEIDLAASIPGDYTITFTPTGGVCLNPIEVPVTINALPTASVSGTTALCQNDTAPNITFTGANGTAPYTFTYKIGEGPDLTVSTTEGNSVDVSVPTGTVGAFTYTLLSVSDANCSQAQSGSATVTVNALPTASVSGTTAVCQNDTSPNITFTGANGTAPYTFTYKIGDGSDLTVSTTEGNSVDVSVPTDSVGTYVYTLLSVSDANCSQAQNGSAAVTVIALPTASVSGTTAVCKDDTSPDITFTGTNGTPPYTFTYKIGEGPDLTVVTTGGNTAVVSAPTDSVGAFTYTLLSVSDSGSLNCSQAQSGSAVVTINSLPAPPTLESDPATCTTDTGTIRVTSLTTGLMFSLDSTDPSDPSEYDSTSIFNSVSQGSHTVYAMNGNGCVSSETISVGLDTTPPASPTISVVEPSLCGPATGSITVLSPLDTEDTDYEYSLDGIVWQSNPSFTGLVAGSNPIIYVQNMETGCVSSTDACEEEEEAPAARMSLEEDTSIKQLPSKTTIKAYPNPFNDQVNFKVLAPEDSKGSLELMNLLGQRVKMVFEGDLKQGENSYNVNLPALQNNTLIYVLTVNGERVTGKLVQSRR